MGTRWRIGLRSALDLAYHRPVWLRVIWFLRGWLQPGALAQAKYMLSGLVVHPDNMKRNLQLTDGLVNTEAVMMALGPKIGRAEAHDKLSTIPIAVSQGWGRLIDLLSNDAEIAKIFDRTAIERLLEPTSYRVLGGRGD